jgi:hypothetical protein
MNRFRRLRMFVRGCRWCVSREFLDEPCRSMAHADGQPKANRKIRGADNKNEQHRDHLRRPRVGTGVLPMLGQLASVADMLATF